GIVLYEMLAGRPPFAAGTDVELMTATQRDAPAPLPGSVPWTVARLVARCLEKDPIERFQSARDLAADLREALAPGDRGRARRWLLIAAGVAALAAAPALLLARRSAPAPLEAGVNYSRLTFRSGAIGNARLAPDERTVIYSANFGAE